jgi:NitT/TauT family transport system substrate-binding protein
MIRKFTHCLAALLAVCALIAAGPASAQMKKLKMMYTAVNGFAASYVAQEQGFFAKRGIDVEFILTQSSGNNPPALVSGSVDIAGPTVPTVLQANDAGLDIVIFAGGTVYPLPGDILVARQGSGIEKPADLKGKTVGVPGLGALLHFMLVRSLKSNGIDPKSVRFVEVGFAQAADALKGGQIDAYPSQAPFTARILQSGSGYEVSNWLKNTPDGTLTVVYTATRKWANDNKDTVKALRDALHEADAYIKAHPEDMHAAVAKYTKLPAAVVASIPLPNENIDITPEQLKFWIDLAHEQEFIKGNPDPKAMLFQP